MTNNLDTVKLNAVRLIPDTEAFKPSESQNGDIVDTVYGVRKNEDSPRHEVRTRFDFTGVSREQLLSLCMYELKVYTQSILRKAEIKDGYPQPFPVLKVLEYVSGGRRRLKASPTSRARAQTTKMSSEERRRFAEELMSEFDQAEEDQQ